MIKTVFDTTVYVRMRKEMRQTLKEEARLLNITMADLIRLAVGDYLALKEEGEMEEA